MVPKVMGGSSGSEAGRILRLSERVAQVIEPSFARAACFSQECRAERDFRANRESAL